MGAIINFFKGIIGLVTGLFSGGKKTKDGFFMEAPPVEGSPAPAAVAPAPAPKKEKAAKSKKKKGGVPESAKKQKKEKAPKGKKVAAAAAAAAATVAAAPVAEPVSAIPSDPVKLVQAALAASAPKTAEESVSEDPTLNTGQPTFAEMNAVPYSTAPRRRPGANLTAFKDMAKTMKK